MTDSRVAEPGQPRRAPRRRRRAPFTRDRVLFTSGLLLTANEALLRSGERPTLLFLFAAMMGLPVVMRSDDKRKQADS
jgi:hypothetical protein